MANLYYVTAELKVSPSGPAGTEYAWENWTAPEPTDISGIYNLDSHAVAESEEFAYAELPYNQMALTFRVGKDPDNTPITKDVYFRYTPGYYSLIWYGVYTISTDEFVKWHVAAIPSYEKLVGAGTVGEDGSISVMVDIPSMAPSQVLGEDEYYKTVKFTWKQGTITVAYEDAVTNRYYVMYAVDYVWTNPAPISDLAGNVYRYPQLANWVGYFWDTLPISPIPIDVLPTHTLGSEPPRYLRFFLRVEDQTTEYPFSIVPQTGCHVTSHGTMHLGYALNGTDVVSLVVDVDLEMDIAIPPGDTADVIEYGKIEGNYIYLIYRELPVPETPEGYYFKSFWFTKSKTPGSLWVGNPRIQDPNYSLKITTSDADNVTLSTATLPYDTESAARIAYATVIQFSQAAKRICAILRRELNTEDWYSEINFATPAATQAWTFNAPATIAGASVANVEYNILSFYSGQRVIVDNRQIWDGEKYIDGQPISGDQSGTEESSSTTPESYSKSFSSALPFYTHIYTTYFDSTTGAQATDHELRGPHYTDTVSGTTEPGTTVTITTIPAPPGTTVTEDPDTGLPVVTVTQPPIPYPEDTGDSGEKEVISPTDGSVKDPGAVTPVTDSVPLTAADYIQGVPGYPTNYFVSVGGTDVVAFAYNVTESQILSRVFRILGVTQEGQQPSAAQISCAREALGALIRSFQDRGVHFWTTAWMYVALSTTPSSVLGTDGKYYRCINSHISDSDNKPITGKNWTSYWLETTTATTTVWTTSTTYYSNNMVLDPTLDDLEQAFIRDTSGYDTTLELVDAKAWGELSNKNEIGRPTKIWLNRTLTRTIQLWPIPDLTTYVLHYRRIRYLNDFTAVTGTGDFPQSWIDAIIFHLAHRLSFEYGNPIQEREELKMTAMELEAVARGYNHERPTSNRLASCY